MKVKLTQTIMKELEIPLKPESKGATRQVEVWDEDLRGFGARVSSSGTKTFFVFSRVNSRLVRVTIGKYPAMTVDEARKKARRMLVEMQEGRNPNDEVKNRRSGLQTVGGVFKHFMETRKDRRENLTERTQEQYTLIFNKHLAPLKGRHVSEITSQMVQDLHAKIGKDRGTNAANQAMRLLRRLMNYSTGRYHVPIVNPCKGVEWFEDGRRLVNIKPADMPKWFEVVNSMENETARDYFLLVLFTGLRRNEAMSLTWENIDLHEKTLTVPDTKNKIPHTLPLSKFLLKLLKDRHERWHQPAGYVFPSWSSKGHLVNVQHGINKLRAASLPYTLHDLRRTFLTIAEGLDISTWAVKRLANHKQTDVTGQHYVSPSVERLRVPMERISTELLRLASEKRGKVIELRPAA